MGHIRYTYKKRWIVFCISLIDSVGYSVVNILKRFKKPHPAPDCIKNILIFKLDHIGDVLMVTPALKFLKSRYRGASITVVVGSWSKDILKDNPDVDEILVYDAYWFNRNKGKKFNMKKTWRFIQEMRRKKFDIFYSFRGDFMGILIGAILRIPIRIGFNNGGGGFLLTNSLTPLENAHQIEQFLYAARENSFNIQFCSGDKDSRSYSYAEKRDNIGEVNLMRIVIAGEDMRFADTFIKQYSMQSPLHPFKKGVGAPIRRMGRGIFVGFHMGAGYSSKLWIPEKYGILIKRLHEDFGIRAILVGGEEDEAIIKRIQSIILDTGSMNSAGRTNIKETAALIEKCRLFIGNDSAPVHIAAAVGVPVIVIFSAANNPVGWKPVGKDVICITKDVPCRSCEKSECVDTKCMRMVTVDEVYDKAKEILMRTGEQKLKLNQRIQ
jgi:ADP-heptose:LPS heptosyltransferase